MDLAHLSTPPTDDERAALDAVLGPESHDATTPLTVARSRRHLLLPALHALQQRRGFLSAGGLGHLCRRLEVPPAEAFGVASFYALFALAERPKTVVHLCDDVACKVRGADRLRAELGARLGPAGRVATIEGRECTWLRSPCLGLCEQAPAALLTVAGEAPHERGLGGVDLDALLAALGRAHAPADRPLELPPQPGPLRLLRRAGKVDPTSLDDYRAHGGFQALQVALERGPAWVLREISDAGLVGRGGAAFPTGRKWEAVARSPVRTRWLVCNADESEPGTFKDRVLVENDPYALVEAMVIAGTTIGAERGMVYLRAEYPLALERLAHAIEQSRARGILGPSILGRGARFELEIRRGAGAYVCGEETALFQSIEGKRGEPRSKPPYPVDHGLFGLPTLINNVETLVNVLPIVSEGAARWRALGTAGSPGTRLFCVSGTVRRPGVYELPLGTRLSELIALAGGVPEGRTLRAVLLGGAAGTFLRPDEIDLPLTFEDAREAGATLGSGVVLLLDDSLPILPVLRRISEFFKDESCGQCVPCRVGTVRVDELVERLQHGLSTVTRERALLDDLGAVMKDASICGLGQTATAAIESALDRLDLRPPCGDRP